MGYESRLFIMEKVPEKEKHLYPFGGREIAQVRMCKCDMEFVKLFNKDIDFTLLGDGETDITEDHYGEVCRYADLEDVLAWLTAECENPMDGVVYRRYSMLKALLESLTTDDWTEKFIVVHSGY